MELVKGNDVEIGFEENQRRLSVIGGRCVEIMLPNPTSGVGVGGRGKSYRCHQANLQRRSSVEKKGMFYLMASFCLKYLANKSKGKGKVRV